MQILLPINLCILRLAQDVLSIIRLVPFGEFSETLTKCNLWSETEITLKRTGVCIRGRYITWSFDKLRMYCMEHHVLWRRSAEPVEADASFVILRICYFDFDNSLSLSKSPAINASFFARDHFFSWRSRLNACWYVSYSSLYTNATGLCTCVNSEA